MHTQILYCVFIIGFQHKYSNLEPSWHSTTPCGTECSNPESHWPAVKFEVGYHLNKAHTVWLLDPSGFCQAEATKEGGGGGGESGIT